MGSVLQKAYDKLKDHELTRTDQQNAVVTRLKSRIPDYNSAAIRRTVWRIVSVGLKQAKKM
jgi:hypothetical protein